MLNFMKSLFPDPFEHIAANQANPNVCRALTLEWICSIIHGGREGGVAWCKEVSQYPRKSDYYEGMRIIHLSLVQKKFADAAQKRAAEFESELNKIKKKIKKLVDFRPVSAEETTIRGVKIKELIRRKEALDTEGLKGVNYLRDDNNKNPALTLEFEKKGLNLCTCTRFKEEGWSTVQKILRNPMKGISGCIFGLFVEGEPRGHAVAMAFVPTSDGGIRQYYYDPNAYEVLVGEIKEIAEEALRSMRHYGYVNSINIVKAL